MGCGIPTVSYTHLDVYKRQVSGVVANIQEVTKAANDGAASTGSIAERVTNVDRQAEDMRVLMKQTQEASLMLRKDTKKFTVA